MAKGILIEVFHVNVFVSQRLADVEARAVRGTLDSARFQTRLERAVRALMRRYRSLRRARTTLTR